MINERLAHSVTLIAARRQIFRKSKWWEDKNQPDPSSCKKPVMNWVWNIAWYYLQLAGWEILSS